MSEPSVEDLTALPSRARVGAERDAARRTAADPLAHAGALRTQLLAAEDEPDAIPSTHRRPASSSDWTGSNWTTTGNARRAFDPIERGGAPPALVACPAARHGAADAVRW